MMSQNIPVHINAAAPPESSSQILVTVPNDNMEIQNALSSQELAQINNVENLLDKLFYSLQ